MFKKKTVLWVALFATLSVSSAHAFNLGDIVDSARQAISNDSDSTETNATQSNPAKAGESRIAIGFSPEGSAQAAILEFINSAQKEILVSAYSFTSPEIVRALTQAKRRGVDVKIVVDYKGNTAKSSVAAMNLVVNAGIQIRTIQKYAIHHDKFIIVDRESVETGSFNYSKSANTRNSENVIILYNMPQVATQYYSHWLSRWNDAQPWSSSY
ncbi:MULTISPECIES: phospholipase D family protein [unclassified Providencia]|uniref:phospholipase D family nuclease n=1 Tax=Providencia TaxID=586 RepID=UPI00234B7C7E|nr:MULTISPECIES: phospholipase D family protein [unclassified Providencia]